MVTRPGFSPGNICKRQTQWPTSLATFCAEPAKAGDRIQIYVTGLGNAAPSGDASQGILATGQFAPLSPPYLTILQPTATIDGSPVSVLFSGVEPGMYGGLYRVDVQVPTGTRIGNFIPISISMPNGLADATTTIAVQ